MSGLTMQQLEQELQNELTTSNQLLRLISIELKQIKELTSPSGELDTNITENTSLMQSLGAMLELDMENMPSLPRMTTILNNQSIPNDSNEPDSRPLDTSGMNETNN